MSELSSSERASAVAYFQDLVRPVVEGRRFILIGGPVAGLTGLALHLRGLGAEPPFILGTIRGTGTLPRPAQATWCSLDVKAENIVDGFRLYESILRDLPPDAVQALDRYDQPSAANGRTRMTPESCAYVSVRPSCRETTVAVQLNCPRYLTNFADRTAAPIASHGG